MFKPISVISLTSILCACSTLNVNKFDAGNSMEGARSGFVYPLQFTQFKVEVTRSIANCETAVQQASPAGPQMVTATDVKAHVKAEVIPQLVDDGEHVYIVDSDSLNGFTKVSDLSLVWKDGKLTSINATAADKTAELAISAISGIAKIATSNLGPIATAAASASAAGSNSGKPVVKCQEHVKNALKIVTAKKAEIDAASKKITALTKESVDLQADLAKTGKKPGLQCSLPANVSETQCQLQQVIADLKAEQKKLSQATKLMKENFAKISHTKTYYWPETSTQQDTSGNGKSISDSVLNNWLEDGKDNFLTRVPSHQASKSQFKNQFDVNFKLGKVGSYGRADLTKPDVVDESAEAGIRYRIPANGYLLICKQKMCSRGDSNQIVLHKTPIQQLGYVFNIPFTSKALSAGSLSVTFDELGRPSEASVKQTESGAENLVKVIDSFSEKLVEYKTAKAVQDDEKSELELVQEQTELLKAKKALADATSNLNPVTTPLQQLHAETAMAEQQKKYLDAIAALEPDLPEPVDENAEEIATFQIESQVILAEVAYLQALLALEEAKSKLED